MSPGSDTHDGKGRGLADEALGESAAQLAERCPDCSGRLRSVGAVTRREEARAALAAGLSVLGARGPPTAA